jgi:hypothetical protein
MHSLMVEVVSWYPGLLILVGLAWCLSHGFFWLEYRRLYPERRAPKGPALWVFRYLGNSWELRILRTRQQVPSLEWRRRLFQVIQILGVIVIGFTLISSFLTDPRFRR